MLDVLHLLSEEGEVMEDERTRSTTHEPEAWAQFPPCESPTRFVTAHTVVTASSEYSDSDLAWKSRMDQDGWAAAEDDKHAWLEWDFGRRWTEEEGVYEVLHPTWATVVKVGTKGRAWFDQYITKYTLEYTHDGVEWTTYPTEFDGNENKSGLVEHEVNPPITARALRLHVSDFHGVPSGRVELWGCIQVDRNVTNTITTTTTSTTTATTTFVGGCDASAYHNLLSMKANRAADSGPSIFCWMVMMTHGYEVQLVRDQYQHNWGIFTCEEHLMLSDGDDGVEVGPNESSRPLGGMNTGKGGWGSWVNAGVFLKAWDAVLVDCHYLGHDWVVKVDPDTVFFPDRLKTHLQWSQNPWSGDDAWWLHNWNGGWYMIGAIEVMSRAAVERYGERKAECLWMVRHGGGPCPGAEDSYIARCLNDQLGVERRVDTNCAQHMGGNQCWDHNKVAYHPFKSTGLYEMCVKQATR
jgi:hypothetical protein